jgi:predicted nucleic acid-binding protein
MTLVDSSVWIDHFRSRNRRLSLLLEAGEVLTHALVIGELSMGVFRNREQVFTLLDSLPKVAAATDQDLRGWVESRQLWGRGIGWIDAHLAASALLTPCSLWTLDARLGRVAASVGVAIRWTRGTSWPHRGRKIATVSTNAG